MTPDLDLDLDLGTLHPNRTNTMLNTATRRYIYLTLTITSLAIGALTVAYSSIGHNLPDWLTIATAVYTFLAGGSGILATLNTNPDTTP